MNIRLGVPGAAMHPDVMNAALEAVTLTNERLIEAGQVPHADEAIANGVKWKPEPPGDEHFDHAQKVVARGWGDCDDLAPYKAASLRMSGEDPEARAVVYKSGPKRWHAVVERGDGTIDDPSAAAGMYQYHPPVQAKLAGVDGMVNLATRRVGGVWAARIDVPWAHTDNALSGHGLGREHCEAVATAIEGVLVVGDSAGIFEQEHVGKLCMVHGYLTGDEAMIADGAQLLRPHQRNEALRTARDVGKPTPMAAKRMAARRGYCAVRCGDFTESDAVVGYQEMREAFGT